MQSHYSAYNCIMWLYCICLPQVCISPNSLHSSAPVFLPSLLVVIHCCQLCNFVCDIFSKEQKVLNVTTC